MCRLTRTSRTCSELGEAPDKWSKECPLPLPSWFAPEFELFAGAIRGAAKGDVTRAREQLRAVRSDDLRDWYIAHGQNSGAFRNAHFVTPSTNSTGSREPDPSTPLKREMFKRDCYRCRYCGVRLFSKDLLVAFQQVVGSELFPMGKGNRNRHGVAVVFIGTHDHV